MYSSRGAGGLFSSERSIGLGMTVDERMLYGSARSPGSLLGRSNVPLVGSMGDGSLHSSYRPFLTHDQHNLSASLRMTPGPGRMEYFGELPHPHYTSARQAAPTVNTPLTRGPSVEAAQLQDELRVSRMEETRIRQALQVHEAVIHKNREELNRYRTYMETRDDEMRKTMQMEEERLRTVLDEYKERYDRERARLQESLVKAAKCAQIVHDGLTESLDIEQQIFGYSSDELRQIRLPPLSNTRSLLQALVGMSLSGSIGGSIDERRLQIMKYTGYNSLGGSMGGSIDEQRLIERGLLRDEHETMLA